MLSSFVYLKLYAEIFTDFALFSRWWDSNRLLSACSCSHFSYFFRVLSTFCHSFCSSDTDSDRDRREQKTFLFFFRWKNEKARKKFLLCLCLAAAAPHLLKLINISQTTQAQSPRWPSSFSANKAFSASFTNKFMCFRCGAILLLLCS